MTDYFLSIDQGTTSTRAILFSKTGEVIDIAQEAFPQHFPQNGWVEHNPNDLWQTTLSTCQNVMRKNGVQPDRIISIGITNQRETTLVWNKKTGEPIYNAIVWQDRRTSEYCDTLVEQGLENTVQAKTGLLIDSYFSATKLRWLLNHIPGAREAADRGELAFGTVDTFLLWHLTGGKQHLTDASNASRTMMFNIHTQEWDDELLALFNVPMSMLPEVKDSAADFGVSAIEHFEREIPIHAMAGDQQAALFGQACFEPGMVKSTYGTGCFVIANTGNKPVASQHRLLTTVGYRINGETTYALEGSIFNAGTAVEFLRTQMGLFESANDIEPMARQAADPLNVYFVPAFTGLGAPFWDADARGAMLGLTRDSTKYDMVAAALQAVAFQTNDLKTAMQSDGIETEVYRVDGGMASNNIVLQNLANISNAAVDRPDVIETTALGVACLAGLQSGVFESLEDIAKTWQSQTRFVPAINQTKRDAMVRGWNDAVSRVTTR